MDITSVLTLFGGIGLFLYGMNYLGDAMKMFAGAKLEKILEKLTSSKIRGVLLGTLVTAIIQSSTATSVIVLGFVNAGIMTLTQALPVVLGSNIGSTVTGQLLRLGDIGSQNILLTLMKPSSFAPVLIVIGVILMLFVKKKRLNPLASILLGLGILFVGMTTMETAVAPLRESETFQRLFTMFSNPFLGILVGIVITAIVQSSSASVGILQALTATGAITWGIAIPIIIGMNIGKCVPVFLSSLSANKDAKKVALLHFVTNLIGAILWGGLIYLGKAIWGYSFWGYGVNRGNVADFHTLYNLAMVIVIMPFTGALIRMANQILPNDEEEEWSTRQFELLNDMFLKTPSLALEQSRRVVCDMGDVARDSFSKVQQLFENYDEKLMKEMNSNEDFLDRAETKIGEYLVRITETPLELKDTRLANELLRSVTDFERIGDYCMRLAEVFEYNDLNGVTFSDAARQEIYSMFAAVDNILKTTVEAYKQEKHRVAARVEPLEEVMDSLRLLLEDRHISRLQNNRCSIQAGISYKEILNCTDRIAGHCVNISVFLIQRLDDPYKFDAHEHLKQDHQEMSEEYKALYTYYETLYYFPVLNASESKPKKDTSDKKKDEKSKTKKPEKKKQKA